ncbi:MAG TPA: dihydroorotase [Verrucomicrobiae bacterium]|nr:dihydroorotase [Verrucomicrobiae bacterium]
MAETLLIAGARLLDEDVDGPGFVLIEDGLIAHAGRKPPRTGSKARAGQTLEADGLWLMPGAVDLCARLREPGATHKATIRSETAAAQAGGVTTLVMPPDTRPVIDTPSVVDRIQLRVQRVGGIDVRVLGALTQGLAGEALPDMAALAAAGVVGVTNAYAPLANLLIARRALEYAQGVGLAVHVLPQDASLAAHGCAHEGAVATRLGLPPIPAAAETVAIAQWLALVEETGARVHFGRLSTARGAQMVAEARKARLPVTADVAAHQLFLTEDDVVGYDAACRVMPPLRSQADRDALRAAVKSGVITAICSDHQPHEADAKTNPFPLTEPGISALELLLPLVLRLVNEKILTPAQAAARASAGPADILGLECGRLRVGSPAHLVLIDPSARWTLNAANLRSAGRCTPFDGAAFTGRIVQVFHSGRPVYRA